MLATFISDLRSSPYYNKLIFKDNILCLYVGGSNSAGTFDSNSDFDLVAITLSGESFDASREMFLKYKGRKVHGYYWTIKDVFKFYTDSVGLAGSMYFKNIRPELVIYLNTHYQKLGDLLLDYKEMLGKLACYQLFYRNKYLISESIAKKDLLAVATDKVMYHLCLATSYLTGEVVEKSLLQDIKLICRQPLQTITNDAAIEIICKGGEYVHRYPISVKSELEKLYLDFYKKAIMLNFWEVDL